MSEQRLDDAVDIIRVGGPVGYGNAHEAFTSVGGPTEEGESLGTDPRHHGFGLPAVMAGIRAEGLAFFSGTTYRGERLMRISVSDWATDTDDVDRVVEALLRHAEKRPA